MADGPESVSAVRERNSIKAALKNEFQKQITNPHRHASGEGGVLFDPAVQRFLSMKATQYDHFRPTPKASFLGVMLLFVPIAGYGWLLKTQKEKSEQKLRSGQVAYADRKYKFI